MASDRASERADERSRFLAATWPDALIESDAGVAKTAGKPPVPAAKSHAHRFKTRPRYFSNFFEAIPVAFEMEQERGGGFLFVPVFLAAGAATYFLADNEPGWTALVASSALAVGLARFSKTYARAVLVAALVFVAGMSAAKFETWRAGTQMLGSSISTRLTARVVAIEHRADRRVRLTMDVVATERPHLRYEPDRLRATARSVPDGLKAGDGVTGVVRLLPTTGPVRPLSYDFTFESYFDRIGANGFFLSGPFFKRVDQKPGLFARVAANIENARSRLAKHISGHVGGAEGEIAAALVTGVRSGIPEAASESLRGTGLAHILAISGLHMALVTFTVILAIRKLFALFPDFSSRHPVKKYSAGAALGAVSFYLLLSGAAVAAQRAYIMIAVMLVAIIFDRAALTMRNLAIAAIIVVAVSPHEVVGPSFQMSFAATAALIAAYGWFAERRRDKPPDAFAGDRSVVAKGARFTFMFIGGLALTSVIAGLATGIYAAWFFQRAAPLGLVANLAAMPLVTTIVMPSAVFGVVASLFGFGDFFFSIMGWGIARVLDIAAFLAKRTPFDDVGLIPPDAVILLTIFLVLLTLLTTWLRIAALPFLAAGIVVLGLRDMPDILVSEDGRQVAVLLSDGRMAVNRARPNAFTVENWQRALMATKLVKPEDATLGSTPRNMLANDPTRQAFVCDDGLCLSRLTDGAIIAYAKSQDAAEPACAFAAIVIIDDATASNDCPGDVTVITKRDLALNGSAAIYFDDTNFPARPRVTYAITQPFRAWHDHRKYSREARGLAPWKRKPKKKSADNAEE